MIENEILCEMIKNDINVNDNMLRLYEQNRGFIYQQIKTYLHYAEQDDLFQEAFLALYEALAAYKPDSGLLFVTYYRNAIRWRINRYLNTIQSVSLPANMQTEINRYKSYVATYTCEHGTAPDNRTIQTALNLDKASYKRLMLALDRIKTVSLNQPLSDDHEMELIDVVSGKNNTEQIEKQIDSEIRHRIITDQIKQLEPLQQKIIHLSYYDGLNDRQVSDALECPESKTKNVKAQAIRKLRKNFYQINRETKLFEEYEEACTGIYRNHSFTHTGTSSTEHVGT